MEDFNAPPSVMQQFTGQAPSPLPQGFGALSPGARAFAREYLPDDDDSGCKATFRVERVLQTFLTEQNRQDALNAGREPDAQCEVYKNVDFINITVIGNEKLIVDQPVNESHKKRFPHAWQSFKRGIDTVSRGTPLGQLEGMAPALITACLAKNISSIEDLAILTDTHLSNMGMGAREFRSRAVEFVRKKNEAKSNINESAINELRSELDMMRQEVAKKDSLLERAMELLNKHETLVEAKPEPKKRGRKPKVIESVTA